MCLQVLCNLRPPPPRCCTLNRRRWQSSLFPLGPRHLPTPRRTHAHTPSPHPQDEAASSSCRSRVGSESRRPSDGPALRLLGSRRNAHPSPDCSARPRRSANCKSWKVRCGCGGLDAPYRLAFACQEPVRRRRQDLSAPRLSLSWLSVPR